MYDLILENYGFGGNFVVQNEILTEKTNFAVWPKKMPSQPVSVCGRAILVLKRKLGYAEAQRMKERCEAAWGAMGHGLNYDQLP